LTFSGMRSLSRNLRWNSWLNFMDELSSSYPWTFTRQLLWNCFLL